MTGRWLWAAAFVAAARAASAQFPPMANPPIVVPVPVPVVPVPRALPDPTVPDPRLKEILTPPKGPVLSAAPPKQSELRLRGRVIGKDRAAAVLEIDGQTFFLPVGGEGRSVRVRAITPDGVTVEVGTGREVRVLH